ncbi:helix-turn-helix domain-containing protein [Tenacibaculum ovolyticum]|uniref:AraC family transcriptional regulator n=1 Tax=Tenacibaculum ovolyticum TaxID=104270 RepID=UPI0022F39CE1|nr:AraC family transcriptional regulator [Tenacibaculum ovolyticum]WBX76769.1 helix-turn-helix domain-containing protein [Tenacibaculum ovolyticum]
MLKSKQLKDSIKMANAYVYLSESSAHTKASKYCDSIIMVTKNIKSHKDYPAMGYLNKGKFEYFLGNYNKALSLYLISLKYAKNKNNQRQVLINQGNIAIIKLRLGKSKETLEAYREYVSTIEKLKSEHKNYYLINAYLGLSNTYIQNKKNDSASIYIKKGLELSLSSKDTIMYSHYLIWSGVNSLQINRFDNAVDSLKKGLKTINNGSTKALGHLNLGKSYLSLREDNKGVFHLKKVDSFLTKTKNIFYPELLSAYKPLIKYYKRNDNTKKQVYYLDRLLGLDSLFISKNKFLSKKISNQYDIPNLMFEREELIKSLSKKNKSNKKSISTLIIVSILILLLTFHFLRKNFILRKRFQIIIQQINKKEKIKKNKLIEKQPSKIQFSGVSEELTEKILKGLYKFEKTQRFLTKKYTLNSLAKELNTNSTYLSKVINIEKQTNFANYLNNLKIDYAINRLSNDKQYRAYTIKAISEEAGFNSQLTFSIAFHKKTQIQPSYFIKQLNKKQNTM